jgi:chemotaxis protein histidine kinase CheA
MSVTPSSTIVGVFRDRSAAEQAINALYKAGFGHEQIQYSIPGTSGSFLKDLKSLFTGTSTSEGNLANDLTNMGLSDAEAQYYSHEYNNGKLILAVRAPGREMEAMQVLRQYGAYNAGMEPGSFRETIGDVQQPGDDTQQGNDATSGQYNNVQDWGTQPQSQTVEEYPFAEAQPDHITPRHDADDQNAQPVTPGDESEPPSPQASVVAPEHDTHNRASQTDGVTSEREAEKPVSQAGVAALYKDVEYQTAQANEVAPEHDTNEQGAQPITSGYESEPHNAQANVAVPETDTDDQASQADIPTPEQESGSQAASSAITGYDTPSQMAQTGPVTPGQETEMQSLHSGVVATEHTDELQQLQAQLQTLQQQLQEAKAQLQAAKEHEDLLKTAREREQQLQSARQQLQELQAELQATLAELREIQSRIVQYQ